MNYLQEYKDCISYIDSYWDRVTYKPRRQKIHHQVLYIPHVFLTPNDQKFNYLFYWDTYFMFRGILGTKHEWITKEMVENFAYLFERFHIIPNFNSPASTGNSQPPFFTSMIWDTFNVSYRTTALTDLPVKMISKFLRKPVVNKSWLRHMLGIAKQEYWDVWIDNDNYFHHKVEGFGLQRYGDRDLGYPLNAERESGWDFTSRFYSRCNQFLPVDLNVYLYKYEKDFAYEGKFFKRKDEKEEWEERARKRSEEIQSLMWDEEKGFFFDYGFYFKRRSDFFSLAGYTPLWAGIATQEQAKKMVANLKRFQSKYGLFITDKDSLAKPIDLSKVQKRYHPAILDVIQPKQWDWPHIWSPMEYLTVVGLLRYGYIKEAKQIMEKSLKAHARLYRKYGTFFEKIDGETGEKPKDFHYPTQSGFGWTNAIFYRYIRILHHLQEYGDESIYAPEAKTPPYDFSIII